MDLDQLEKVKEFLMKESIFNNEFFKSFFKFFDKTKFLDEDEVLLKISSSGIVITYKSKISDYIHTEICKVRSTNGSIGKFEENQDYSDFFYMLLEIFEKYNNKYDDFHLVIANEPNNDKEIDKVLDIISEDQLKKLYDKGYSLIKKE